MVDAIKNKALSTAGAQERGLSPQEARGSGTASHSSSGSSPGSSHSVCEPCALTEHVTKQPAVFGGVRGASQGVRNQRQSLREPGHQRGGRARQAKGIARSRDRTKAKAGMKPRNRSEHSENEKKGKSQSSS